MKKINKKIVGLFSLLVFIFLSFIPSILVNEVEYDSERVFFDFNLESSQVSWNTSDYINFTGPLIDLILSDYRIFIDDNDVNYNWSGTAQNNSWCTGSGTYSDPYVIENLYIDGQGLGGMIYIKNSDKFFIIRNNWFNYSGPGEHEDGVLLHRAENGLIENNIFTYTHKGVLLELDCNNITVSDNIMISDHTTAGLGRSIHVQNSENVTVINNKIRNYYHPIGVVNSFKIDVDSNYIENTIFDVFAAPPLELKRTDNSSMVNNILFGAYADAAFRIGETDSTGNTITDNIAITGDPVSFGPETAGLTLSVPQLQANPVDTISIDDSHNNVIAHNRLLTAGGAAEAIPGFELLTLLGMFGVISVLLVIVKRKRR